MTLEARLAALVAAIGADIKELQEASGGSSAVPYFLAAGDTFSVAENTQALFSVTINNEGWLDVEGLLVEV